jgi:mannosylglycerate hydrolase
VPHTHWDREWYEPFQVFRMRLVELVDQLLEQMSEEPDFSFTLDGQLATVDDYLEVRPEAEPRIRALIAEGRLAVGPWQILMDEFLVSGETIVRNLEMGWRRAEDLDGAMRVGYLPDMFGHIAQMPQLLRGAGIEDAVVWRGVPAAIEANAFRWRSPDGSEVRAEYLVGGYGSAAYLFALPERLGDKVGAYHEQMRAWYGDRSLLAMYGTDHAVPVRDLETLVRRVNGEQDRYELRLGTLGHYLAEARRADEESGRSLAVWQGELRSGARANMLPGVASARIDLKQAAGLAERWLERYAEPLQALHGGDWPSGLLDLAWRRLVENSAHDSICGCSVDPVVDQVLARYAEATQIARGLADRAAGALGARVERGYWLAVNPTPSERSGLVELTAPIPDGWPAVGLELPDGRRIGTQEVSRNRPLLNVTEMPGGQVGSFLRRRLHGRELFGRSLNGFETAHEGGIHELTLLVDDEEDPPHLDVDDVRSAIEMAALAAAEEPWRVRIVARPRRTLQAVVTVPALGWRSFRLVEGEAPVEGAVRVVGGRGLRNERLSVTVADDGTLRLEAAGAVLEGAGRLVEGGDHGDSYDYGPPPEDRLVEAPTSVAVEVRAEGPVSGILAVRRTYDWPLAMEPDGRGRSAATARTEVTMFVELRAAEPFVRLRFEFENRSSDHRLRCHIPLPGAASHSAAAGGLAVVERALSVEGGYGEAALPTFPATEWVDAGGVAALLEHVVEYELVPGRDGVPGGELALTLLRSFGLISRNDNPAREDPAGPERPTPKGQCRGPWSVSFALYPHAADWHSAGVPTEAERFRHPLLVAMGRAVGGDAVAAPPEAEGLRLTGTDMSLTSLRRRDGWLELRLVRLAPDAGRATIRLPSGIAEARYCDLLGRPGTPIPVGADGSVDVELGSWQIGTVQLRAAA